MWNAWDLVADYVLAQLPELIRNDAYEFAPSDFFQEQLKGFRVWLQYGGPRERQPDQLPVVLQVLLSQAHRHQALELLGDFLETGPRAVNQALSVGIFPYVLKLLQAPAGDLRATLVQIWGRVMAVDATCRDDLLKSGGHAYFVQALAADAQLRPEVRASAAFVLAALAAGGREGQLALLHSGAVSALLDALRDGHAALRRWAIIALGLLWDGCEEVRASGVRERAHERLCYSFEDSVPEVRAAAVFALGKFIGGRAARESEARRNIELNLGVTLPVGDPLISQIITATIGAIVVLLLARAIAR